HGRRRVARRGELPVVLRAHGLADRPDHGGCRGPRGRRAVLLAEARDERRLRLGRVTGHEESADPPGLPGGSGARDFPGPAAKARHSRHGSTASVFAEGGGTATPPWVGSAARPRLGRPCPRRTGPE